MGTDDQVSIWQEIVNRFRGTASDFQKKHDEMLYYLNTIKNYPQPVQDEFNELLNRGDTIKTVIQRTTQTIDTVAQWLSDQFGGVNANQFGAIQFLPIATVAIAVTLLGRWITETIKFITKINEIERLQRDQNMTADQAYKQVQTLETSFFNIGFLKPLLPILILGAVFILLPKIKRLR